MYQCQSCSLVSLVNKFRNGNRLYDALPGSGLVEFNENRRYNYVNNVS